MDKIRLHHSTRRSADIVVAITTSTTRPCSSAQLAPAASGAGNAVVLSRPGPPVTRWRGPLALTTTGCRTGCCSVTGHGGALRTALGTDPRVRKVSFKRCRPPRVSTHEDFRRDNELSRRATRRLLAGRRAARGRHRNWQPRGFAAGGTSTRGQVCISGQRGSSPTSRAADSRRVVPKVGAIRNGDPRSADTAMGR